MSRAVWGRLGHLCLRTVRVDAARSAYSSILPGSREDEKLLVAVDAAPLLPLLLLALGWGETGGAGEAERGRGQEGRGRASCRC